MSVGVVILSVIFGGLLITGVIQSFREAAAKEALLRAPPAPIAEEEASVGEDDVRAQVRYLDAWDGLGGLSVRLELLAVASDELAHRCRRQALIGGEPIRALEEDDYWVALPAELRDSATRPGPARDWQALDRALAHLSAIHESPDPGVHADAHEHLSLAGGELVRSLREVDVPQDIDHCWFCTRAADQVTRLLYSPHAAICEDCVQSCHERLHEL